MNNENVLEKLTTVSSSVRFLTISFLLMVLAYLFTYLIGGGDLVIYLVIPFAIIYWLSVVWISWVVYGPVMCFVAVVGIAIPPLLLVIMILSYSRAPALVKNNEMRLSFWGRLTPRRS